MLSFKYIIDENQQDVKLIIWYQFYIDEIFMINIVYDERNERSLHSSILPEKSN